MPRIPPLASTQKKRKNSVNAPSQLNQGSRKGKKSWRKNVDIEDVEQGLENIRAEERVTGSALQKKTDDDLFAIDLTGDDRVKRTLARLSKTQLTCSKILAQRSAVPAVTSRVVSSSANQKRKNLVSHGDKGRLLRIGKRSLRGPFNAVMDPTEFGAGSALLEMSKAVMESGKYDVWNNEVASNGKVKPPPLSHPRGLIEIPAVVKPHQGASYNPPAPAHQELLRTAHEIEEQRVRTAEEHKDIRDKIAMARRVESGDQDESLPVGMSLDQPNESGDEDEEDSVRLIKPLPQRKTKQQRRKAEKQRAEKRALADKLTRRRLLSSVATAKSFRKSLDQAASSRERVRLQKQLLLKEKLKRGLAGQRLGRHTVQKGDIDVQLGEDLSESLRGLKPEGNLFRDRFISMQHRALIEPRTPVLPRKTRIKFKETEKHAWKRFD